MHQGRDSVGLKDRSEGDSGILCGSRHADQAGGTDKEVVDPSTLFASVLASAHALRGAVFGSAAESATVRLGEDRAVGAVCINHCIVEVYE